MAKRLLLILSLNVLVLNLLIAQKQLNGMGVRSDVIEVKNGRKHFVHIVKSGETLYSISKTYHIPIQDIASINEDMLLIIKSGQRILIPANPISPEDEGANYYFFFVAEDDMSLYKASQHYKFQIDDFLKLNPTAQTGIRKGEVIKVPKERTVITEELTKDTAKVKNPINIKALTAPCRTFSYDKSEHTFKVTMLLPLFLDKNKSALDATGSGLSRAKFDSRTSRFLEYLHGVMMAADQLRKEGVNVELSVYDTKNSKDRISQLLDMGVVDGVDLVVGPVYSKHYMTVSNYLKGKDINQVSPLSRNTRLVSNNHNSYLLTPSDKTLFEALSYFVSKRQADNIVLIHNGTKKEMEHAGIFKQRFVKEVSNDSLAFNPKFKMVNYKLGGIRSIEQELDSMANNVVIIPSNREVFVTDIVAKVKVLSLKYPTVLLGLDVWENYANLSLDNLHSLKLHYATTQYIDYDNPRVLRFVQNYRFMFKAEPSNFVFQGHDGFLYFGQALKRFGKSFNYCLGSGGVIPNRVGLCSEWNFENLDEFSGFENKTVYVVKYDKGTKLSVHKIVMKDGEVVDESELGNKKDQNDENEQE